jgi:hypothetical protein
MLGRWLCVFERPPQEKQIAMKAVRIRARMH